MERPLHGLLSPSKQEREELARQHGWEWYGDDNWIKTEWRERGMKIDMAGKPLDYVYMNIMQSQEDISIENGFQLYDPLLSSNIGVIKGLLSINCLSNHEPDESKDFKCYSKECALNVNETVAKSIEKDGCLIYKKYKP
jgi:hypothetical protein